MSDKEVSQHSDDKHYNVGVKVSMQVFQITHDNMTITVPIDVRASWLELRFALPPNLVVLGVVLQNNVEIDLTVDNNTVARSMLGQQNTALLLHTKRAKRRGAPAAKTLPQTPGPVASNAPQLLASATSKKSDVQKQTEAAVVEQFLKTGNWPLCTLMHLVLNQFHIPVEIRKIIIKYAAPVLRQEDYVFSIDNIGYQLSNPTAPAVFVLTAPTLLRRVRTTHYWLNVDASTMDPPATLGVLHVDSGTTYGPWSASSTAACGRPSYYWNAEPLGPKNGSQPLILPVGTYRVIDSDPGSWSMNGESGNAGFCGVIGTTYKMDDPKVWGL